MSEVFKKRLDRVNDTRTPDQKMGDILRKAMDVEKVKTFVAPTSGDEQQMKGWWDSFGKGFADFAAGAGILGLGIVGNTLNGLIEGLVGVNSKEKLKQLFEWMSSEGKEVMEKFSDWWNKMMKRNAMRELIDEIHICGYSIQVNASGSGERFYVCDSSGKQLFLSEGQKVSNGQQLNPLYNLSQSDKGLAPIFESVMIERSLTASRGEAGVVELKKHLNLDITDDRAIESITPQQIAEAYKKMYTGSEKMPPEVRDLVNNMNNFQSSDFGFAKDVFREYRDITVQAKQGIGQATKEVVGNGIDGIINVLENPLSALSKVKDPLSLLFLIGGLGYGLFFSEHKKKIWLSLAAIYGGNAVLQAASGQSLFERGRQAKKFAWDKLDDKLNSKKYLSEAFKEQDAMKIVLIMTEKKSKDILGNINIDPLRQVATFKNYETVFNQEERESMKKVYGSEEKAKEKVDEVINKFLEECGKRKGKMKENRVQTFERLKKEYYPQTPEDIARSSLAFGEAVFAELSEIPTYSEKPTEPINVSLEAAAKATIETIPQKIAKIKDEKVRTALEKRAGNIEEIKRAVSTIKVARKDISVEDAEVLNSIEQSK